MNTINHGVAENTVRPSSKIDVSQAGRGLARAIKLLSRGRVKKATALLNGLKHDGLLGAEASLLLSAVQSVSEPVSQWEIEEAIISRAREFYETGDCEAAQMLLAQARWKQVRVAEIQMLLGAAHIGLEDYNEAIVAFQGVLKEEPNSAAALSNIAVCHYRLDDLDATKQFLERSLSYQPGHPQSLNLFAELFKRSDDTGSALRCYEKAIASDPLFYDAYINKASLLETAYSPTHALNFIRTFDVGLSSHSVTKILKSRCFEKLGQYKKALASVKDIAADDAEFADALIRQARAHSGLDQKEEAVRKLQQVISIDPDNDYAYFEMGKIKSRESQISDAINCYKKALSLRESSSSLSNLALELGKTSNPKSMELLQRAIELEPNDAGFHHNICLEGHYHSEFSAHDIFEHHKRFGLIFNQPHSNYVEEQCSAQANGKLRIGFVSSDLRGHSISYFLMPLLETLDYQKFETFFYFNGEDEDPVTKLIRDTAFGWRKILHLDDQLVVDQINSDQINILFDLNGHTGGSRLTLFAKKPAPVQTTWLGYPNTTGLEAVDYRLSDDISDPPGLSDQLHTEEVIRLKTGPWCYSGHEEARPSGAMPLDENGYLTFGSFNNTQKLNARTLSTWSKILDQFDDARLIIKGMPLNTDQARSFMIDRLLISGIDPDRVELIGWTATKGEHYGLYDRLDIALDPFPFNGATTTCEALWMGVPVISLLGETHAGRVGASLLSRVGLHNLIADSQEEYVSLAVRLGQNPAKLRTLRSNLRPFIEQSPLCDKQLFATEFQNTLNHMWNSFRLEQN